MGADPVTAGGGKVRCGRYSGDVRQLGVDRQTSLIAIQPYTNVDRVLAPLYNAADTRAALGDSYGRGIRAKDPGSG